MKFFTLVRSGELRRTPSHSKIIPQEEFSQLVTAAEIVQRTEQEEIEHRAELRQQKEKTLAEAKKAGFEEGLAQFHDLLLHFDRQLQEIRHEVSRQILPLALKAAKKVVARQLDLHPETIVDIVRQALTPITENRHIILYVNKQDKEHLEREKPQLLATLKQIESFSIQESADIEPGGCRIWTESGFLNVERDTQWRALEKACERYLKGAHGST